MTTRDELISKALAKRLDELRHVRAGRIKPEKFGASAEFVHEALAVLRGEFSGESAKGSDSLQPKWLAFEADCLSSLRALCLGKQQPFHEATRPPLDAFLESLHESRKDARRSFNLLAERYSCPLNFSLPDEGGAREYVLGRLMVQERARVESDSVEAVDADYMLLKLNLVAVHARVSTDLRFLDALNYYYELLNADWHPRSRHGWLLVSYYALYARALAARA